MKNFFTTDSFCVTNEPQHIKCGAPDYVVQNFGIPIGYIEAKDIVKNLDKLNKTEQDQQNRYLTALENIIYTNYIDFLLFRYGKLVLAVKIAELKNGKLIVNKEQIDLFIRLINDFLDYKGITSYTAEDFARKMALKAKEFAYVVSEVLKNDSEHTSNMYNQYKVFKKYLIDNLEIKTFADMYAQTITYGLFVARLNNLVQQKFTRDLARNLIPETNPFLRGLFDSITGANLDKGVEWIVDDLINIFRNTDVAEIISKYGRNTAKNDPFLHFYETFLAEYDPELRKKAGVYFTPKPVVNYIVKSIDEILKNIFEISEGLACSDKKTVLVDGGTSKNGKKRIKLEKIFHKLQILDPATGTGTFLAEVVRYIHETFKGQSGLWKSYVEDDLLPRLNGFEIMMVPYAIAHIKIGKLLKKTGYQSDINKRFHIYLTDTLEEAKSEIGTLWAYFLTNEALEANIVKRDNPVMVILGNPPYQRNSQNNGKWITKLMEDYKKEPNSKQKLDEDNPKNINDDYVKFIRYSQYMIDKNNEGMLAFINPNSYLESATFRGVRWSLLSSFDEIYILNLHGNSRKGEIFSKDSAEENVFDIQIGVCINIFVRKKNHSGLGKVFYFDLYGKRKDKYEWLVVHSFSDTQWKEITPVASHYLFTPLSDDNLEDYYNGVKLSDLFPVNSNGFKTHRDKFAVAFTKEEIETRVSDLLSSDYTEGEIKEKYNISDNRDWKLNVARSLL